MCFNRLILPTLFSELGVKDLYLSVIGDESKYIV